jgi:hypothetical protein
MAAVRDRRAAEALHSFYRCRVQEWVPCVQQAIDRGEAPPGTNPNEVIRGLRAAVLLDVLPCPGRAATGEHHVTLSQWLCGRFCSVSLRARGT